MSHEKNFTEIEEGCYYRDKNKDLCGPVRFLNGDPYISHGALLVFFTKEGISCGGSIELIEKVDIVRSEK